MKKSIIVSLAFALVLSLSSLGSAQNAEAKDWSETGSIFTTYYHSGSFTNYTYQRTHTTTAYDSIISGVRAKSSASGKFKAILQKKINGKWKNYRTMYPSKNGYTPLNWMGVTHGAKYRVKFENTSGKKITYTYDVTQ